MSSENTELVRMNVSISRELNDEITRRLPLGTKSEIVRALMRMLLRELRSPARILVIDALIEDEARITYDQNLVKGENR